MDYKIPTKATLRGSRVVQTLKNPQHRRSISLNTCTSVTGPSQKQRGKRWHLQRRKKRARYSGGSDRQKNINMHPHRHLSTE